MFDEIRRRYHLAGLWLMLVRQGWRDRHTIPRLRKPNAPSPPPFDLAREISDDGWRCHVAENRRLFGDEVVDAEIAELIHSIDPTHRLTCRCLRCSYIRVFGEDTPRV